MFLLFITPGFSQFFTPSIKFYPTDPSGVCSPQPMWFNTTNGNLWGCKAGTWTLAGGGGTSGAIACAGTPGNTTGGYRQQCQTSGGTVYACNNASGCTVAADWILVCSGTAGVSPYTLCPVGCNATISSSGTTYLHTALKQGPGAGVSCTDSAGTNVPCVFQNNGTATTAGDITIFFGATPSYIIISTPGGAGVAGPTGTGCTSLSGDVTGPCSATVVGKLNGTSFVGTNGDLVQFGAGNTPADSGVATSAVGLKASPLSQFAATTSAQLAGVLTDESGTGVVCFTINCTMTTPNLGTPSALVLTNATGLPAQSTFNTSSNCSSAASPAVCGSAPAGSVAFPTGVTSVALQVNTSAVTANSQIFLFSDDSLGTKLSVTCNSTLATLAGGMAITARSAGVSFAVTFNGTITTNPLCVNFLVVN